MKYFPEVVEGEEIRNCKISRWFNVDAGRDLFRERGPKEESEKSPNHDKATGNEHRSSAKSERLVDMTRGEGYNRSYDEQVRNG